MSFSEDGCTSASSGPPGVQWSSERIVSAIAFTNLDYAQSS
ncbi:MULTISPECIES: hypothetical protein [unclassified Halomonas]|nr:MULTISPECIES: hypothetical protein [unclassified Halomonas]